MCWLEAYAAADTGPPTRDPDALWQRIRELDADRRRAFAERDEAREMLGAIALCLGLGGEPALRRLLADRQAKAAAAPSRAGHPPIPLLPTPCQPMPLRALRGGDGVPR